MIMPTDYTNYSNKTTAKIIPTHNPIGRVIVFQSGILPMIGRILEIADGRYARLDVGRGECRWISESAFICFAD